MAIALGQPVDPADFPTTPSGTPDSGKVARLDAEGRIATGFERVDFGDGSDGNVTISTPTTLTRDMYYDNLTVNDVLTTANFRIFVRGTLTGNGSGVIQSNGANASGTIAGAATTGYFSNTAGVNGGASSSANNPSVAGQTPTYSLGVNNAPASGSTGGTSGNGNAGGATGALGGTVNLPRSWGKLLFDTIQGVIFAATTLFKIVSAPGAASGPSGGGTGSVNGGAGGGSGASGGLVWIAARIWAGTFIIKALGGNGGNGSNGGNGGTYGGGGGGGGNGGNGGIAAVIYAIKTWAGSYVLTGGTAGIGGNGGTGTNPGGSGTSGTNGATGTSYEFDYGKLF